MTRDDQLRDCLQSIIRVSRVARFQGGAASYVRRRAQEGLDLLEIPLRPLGEAFIDHITEVEQNIARVRARMLELVAIRLARDK